MKKEILLIWFGDNEPAYTKWNVENFKKMNPGWDIVYVNYSAEQLQEKKDSDIILQRAICEYSSSADSFADKGFSKFLTYYIKEYIKSAQYPVVYCDLDCFPIAPFDEFFQVDAFKSRACFCYGYTFNHKYHRLYEKKQNEPLRQNESLRRLIMHNDKPQYIRSAPWCLSNIQTSKCPLMQIYVDTNLEKPLVQAKSWIFNVNQNVKIFFKNRQLKFEQCQLSTSDNACSKFFSPIEHYYCEERKKDCI